MIHTGDCLDVMAAMEPESVAAVVTDPPYGLGFMGKHWDHGVPAVEFWREMWRVAKPSSYLLAFGGTRTVHRIATNIEDAGWVIRDMLVWAYASGFPKSKASLKPAWEPIVMARKPGPLRELAIDACRIAHAGADDLAESQSKNPGRDGETVTSGVYGGDRPQQLVNLTGRWPANVILTDPIFDGGIEGVVGGGETTTHSTGRNAPADYADNGVVGWRTSTTEPYDGDSGTYSRFFLIPKADRAEREPVAGMLPRRVINITEGHGMGPVNTSKGDGTGLRENRPRANSHPTVKPLDLMRHLVRLVTPAGGTVLDPFLGSGTTGLACEMEGFPWIGIEREAEYVAIAEARLHGVQQGMGLAV